MSTTIKIKKSQTIETAAMWQNITFGFVHTLREAVVYPTIQPISIMTPPHLFFFFWTFKLKVSKNAKMTMLSSSISFIVLQIYELAIFW